MYPRSLLRLEHLAVLINPALDKANPLSEKCPVKAGHIKAALNMRKMAVQINFILLYFNENLIMKLNVSGE